jgi:hypothetical protein
VGPRRCGAAAVVTLPAWLREPLDGKTSLTRVFWGYGVLGSLLLSAFGLFIDVGNSVAMRLYALAGLLYTVYVTLATYRCAQNCGSKVLAAFVRVSAVLTLLLLPVLAYLELSGAFDRALATLDLGL